VMAVIVTCLVSPFIPLVLRSLLLKQHDLSLTCSKYGRQHQPFIFFGLVL
jgi:hypothetical protein